MNNLFQNRPWALPLGIVFLIFAILMFFNALRPFWTEYEDPAKPATIAWLKSIDSGKYAKSWKQASPRFQAAVTQQQWEQALQSVRAPLGKMISRKEISARHRGKVPSPQGTLEGDFVIFQFDTTFKKMKNALETVTFEKNGETWKASGYYLRPKS